MNKILTDITSLIDLDNADHPLFTSMSIMPNLSTASHITSEVDVQRLREIGRNGLENTERTMMLAQVTLAFCVAVLLASALWLMLAQTWIFIVALPLVFPLRWAMNTIKDMKILRIATSMVQLTFLERVGQISINPSGSQTWEEGSVEEVDNFFSQFDIDKGERRRVFDMRDHFSNSDWVYDAQLRTIDKIKQLDVRFTSVLSLAVTSLIAIGVLLPPTIVILAIVVGYLPASAYMSSRANKRQECVDYLHTLYWIGLIQEGIVTVYGSFLAGNEVVW